MEKINYPKMVVSGFLKVGSFIILIIWGAGRLDYWQGWVFFVTAMIAAGIIAYLFRNKQDLIKERAKPGPGMKWWDKVFWVFHVLSYFGLIGIGIADGGRYLWTVNIPIWVYILGYIGYLLTYILVIWAMKTNEFFSSVVRIQKDRRQTVCQDGPYKYVRHPGYSGVLLLFPSMAIILGSYWALIPAAVGVVAIIIRTILEDQTLQNELEGYKKYTKKTRYRLIPFIW